MAIPSKPTLRWGIIATGMISSWFVEDLVLPRKDAPAHHLVQAIGSSSLEKGRAFAAKHIPHSSPTIYGSYEQVYADRDVDIVYIGTPHAFHKKNCLDAIAARKHVLCEKAFTITAKEAEEVLAAARAKGVFVMEAMWTRFNPVVLALQKKLHEDKVIGDVRRTFCDFGLAVDVAALGPESRLRNPALGAGSLLDIGIYSLTWGLLTLSPDIAGEHAVDNGPKILAAQTLSDGKVDTATSILLHYPTTGRQGILTSTTEIRTASSVFCRVEGTQGYIAVEGVAASAPSSFTVYANHKKNLGGSSAKAGEDDDDDDDDVSAAADATTTTTTSKPATRGEEVYKFDVTDQLQGGRGFFWEADAVALDIAAARTQNATMPHAETLRVMQMLDEIRRQGGARFPQDDTYMTNE